MNFETILKAVQEAGAFGLLGLIIIFGFFIAREALKLFRTEVIPLVKNHLAHIEMAFDRWNDTADRVANTLDRFDARLERVERATIQSEIDKVVLPK